MKIFPDDSSSEFQNIDITDLIQTQQVLLQEALTSVVQKLREAEMEHRQQYRDQKLQDALPPEDYFSYVYKAIWDNTPAELGKVHLQGITDKLLEFQNLLRERDIDDDSVGSVIDELNYPLAELKQYFLNSNEAYLNKESAEIFCFFIQNKMDKLRNMAKEIDDQYMEEL